MTVHLPQDDPLRPIWQRAASMAARYHCGQTRKDGLTPYVAHPFRVAMTLLDLFRVDDQVVICAALLHDLFEDTAAGYTDICGEFGTAVADTVAALTKDSALPKPERDAAYARQLEAASWRARLVKLADVYDNICDSPGPQLSPKAKAKAERAIAMAHGDPRLESPAQILRDLLKRAAGDGQANP